MSSHLYDSDALRVIVPMPGMNDFRLPWPMRSNETTVYFSLMVGSLLAGMCVVWWASVLIIDPSLWRLAPILVWFVVFRHWVGPAIVRALRPNDLQARRVAFAEQNEPPTGASRI